MATTRRRSPPTPGAYASYVLGVLVLVYVLNFLDRQIISILAEHIRADLGLSDDQIGFLYGTAFAVFYAVFGIPLGRLADVWDRRRLIAIGLAFWSLMTAASGFARSFAQLAAARIGVGVGEASATPAAFSLLSDYFPASRRATVLAIYSSGIYLGAGLGLGLGGFVVDAWEQAWAGTAPPLGLRGWQVAFMVAGAPGLLLALWVRTLREPRRGEADGIVSRPEPHPFRQTLLELRAVLPPLTVLHLALVGGPRAVVLNLVAAGAIAATATGLTQTLGSPAQWIALGLGAYAAVSWAQALRIRDPPAFALIFRTPSLRWATLAFAMLAFSGYGIGFWVPPFFMRVHGISAAEAGLVLGGTAAMAGWLGVMLGGLVADGWRRTSVRGRLHVALVTALAPVPIAWALFTTESVRVAYLLNVPLSLLASAWLGAGASTVQDLVLPRMRATASAAYLLALTFIGLALGPYTIGRLSLALDDLRLALLAVLGLCVIPVVATLLAGRTIARDGESVLDRARAAGEVVG